MAKLSIEESTLTNIANAIRDKINDKNFIMVADMANKIGGIKIGVDTSDATATASDIASGKTAYVAGQKITGTYEASSGGGDLDALIEGTITEVTSNATSVKEQVFLNCIDLTTVSLPLATRVCKYAFRYSGLTTINLPLATELDTYALTDCRNLITIDLPNVTKMGDRVFQNCSKLTTVNIPLATQILGGTFYGCSKLTTVNIPLATRIQDYGFYSCIVLEIIDLPNVTTLGNYVFVSCLMLKAVILRSTTLCTLSGSSSFNSCYHILGTTNSTYNPNGDKDGYIYVPKALIEDYKVATNWVTFASQFRALEDYTVDGTITGELDESKI